MAARYPKRSLVLVGPLGLTVPAPGFEVGRSGDAGLEN